MLMTKYRVVLFLTIIPLLGFGNEPPEKVLVKFLKAFYSNNHKKAYTYLSNADKEIIDQEEFTRRNNLKDPFQQEIAKAMCTLSSYEVTKTVIEENCAVAYTTITSPDMPKVLADIFGPFYGIKETNDSREAMRHMLKQYLKKGNVPLVEKSGEFKLIKEEGAWKIILNPKDNG